jgi:hypothetical protein
MQSLLRQVMAERARPSDPAGAPRRRRTPGGFARPRARGCAAQHCRPVIGTAGVTGAPRSVPRLSIQAPSSASTQAESVPKASGSGAVLSCVPDAQDRHRFRARNAIDDEIRRHDKQLSGSGLASGPAAIGKHHQTVVGEQNVPPDRFGRDRLSAPMWRTIRLTSARARVRQTTGNDQRGLGGGASNSPWASRSSQARAFSCGTVRGSASDAAMAAASARASASASSSSIRGAGVVMPAEWDAVRSVATPMRSGAPGLLASLRHVAARSTAKAADEHRTTDRRPLEAALSNPHFLAKSFDIERHAQGQPP